jgi:hypothetical protein
VSHNWLEVAALFGLVPVNPGEGEPRVPECQDQVRGQKCPVLGAEVIRPPVRSILADDELMQFVGRTSVAPVPNLERDTAAPNVVNDAWTFAPRAFLHEPVVITHAGEEHPARPDPGGHVVHGEAEVVVGQQVRQGVVAGEHDVEIAGNLSCQRPQVGDPEREGCATSGGLAFGAGNRPGAEIGRMNAVTKQSETDGLGADAAGAIEDRVGSRAESGLDECIEGCGLPPHRPVPIGKEQVVAFGQFVVERPHRIAHWRIIHMAVQHRSSDGSNRSLPLNHATPGAIIAT